MFNSRVERIIVAVAVAEIKRNKLDHWNNEDQGYIIADCLKACDRLQHVSGAAVQRLVAAIVDDWT